MNFAQLIRVKQHEIIDRWSAVAQAEAREDLPRLLEGLSRSIEDGAVEAPMCERFGVAEYRIVRAAILTTAAESSLQLDLRELAKLDAELDRLLEAAADRRAAEQRAELHALEARQRLVVEIARMGTWDFDLRSGRLLWSARTREMFGLTEGAETDQELFFERVHPEDRAAVQEHIERAMRGEGSGDIWVTFRVVDPVGGLRWYESRGRTAFDATGRSVEMFGTIYDVTEHRMAAEMRNRYEAATLATRQLLYDWNSLTNAVIMAGRSDEILGFSLEEMPTNLDEYIALIHPDDRATFEKEIERIIATREPAHVNYRMRRKDGSYSIMEDNGRFFFDAEGKPLRMVGFLLDVTEKKQFEEQHDKERRRAEALVELDRVKTEFFGSISHEFRTPLTLILGPVEDALAEPEQSLQGESLSVVHRSAVRLLRLVNHLLEFARMELGQAQTTFLPTDLASMTADLASSFRSLIERAGMKLRVECDALPEPIYVDRSHWERIVLNLLSNAFKYTLEGEIGISLRWKTDHVELTVHDTGIGIPPDELDHVFERFHRVHGARGRSFEGSGIGLALVQELVTLHAGTVRVASVEAQGSTFVVCIPTGHQHLPAESISSGAGHRTSTDIAAPYVLEAANWIVAPDDDSEPIAADDGASRRILVADDNADMRQYLVRLLRTRWHVDAVEDGEAALQAVRQRAPDLIVADVMMPRMDGLGLVRALRAAPDTAAIPVILLTARAGEGPLVDALEAGADDYLVKPFSARELASRVRTHLRMVDVSRSAAEANERVRAEERLRVLAEASAALGESLDHRATISKIAQLAVHALADWCMVDLVGDDGEVRRVEVAHADPAQSELAEAMKRSGARPPLIAREPTVLEPLPRDLFPSAARVRSAMAVPLLARGRSLGTLILGVGQSAPNFSATDLAITRALGRRCAIAIDNARLYSEAQRAVHVRDEFLAIASHELRTPLSSLRLALENLQRRICQLTLDEGSSEWVSSRLATVDRQGKRLQRLVDELLDVSRIMSERLHLSLEPVDLTRVVKDVVMQLDEEGAVARSKCTIDLQVNGEAIGRWDRLRIQQIVTNLLENALKFGQGAPVEISVTTDDGVALLAVRDHGIGIATSDKNRIFERFERAVPERHYGGFGLGLWIVRQIVEAMGGSVHVDSELGEGSTFIVRLPKENGSPFARQTQGGDAVTGHDARH